MSKLPCRGYGGIVCHNGVNIGCMYCASCIASRQQRVLGSYCVARNGRCKNIRIVGYLWCNECKDHIIHLQNEFDIANRKLDSHLRDCEELDCPTCDRCYCARCDAEICLNDAKSYI